MCVNCNDSLQVNLPIGPAGENGVDGQSAYLYVASSSALPATLGTFSYPLDPADNYISVLNTTSPITPVNFNNFTTNLNFTGWHNWQGPQGIQGIQGVQGPLGPFGGVTFEYNFLGFTPTVSAPGNGNLGVYYNGMLPTTLYISTQDLNGGLVSSYFAYLSTLINSTSKAAVRIGKKTDPAAYQIYNIVSGVNSGGYYSFTLSSPSLAYGPTALQSNDDVLVSFSAVGDKGDGGNYVTTATEAPGVNCALGGLRVDLKNGVTNAIISTNYVCKQDNVAAGIINWFAGTSAPSGYLIANGQSVLRATYPNLFAAIGTTYGFTNANDFLVPDLRGLFIRGSGNNVYDPDAPRTVGDLQGGTLESHTHNLLTQSGESYTGTPVSGVNGSGLSNGNTITVTRTTTVPNAPAQLSSETRPVNMALLPCIKY